MGTSLDDASLFHNHDAVGIFYGGQPVGNDKGGSSLHQRVHTILYQFLGTGVDGGGGLVQNQRRGICHGGPGDGQQLPLSLA